MFIVLLLQLIMMYSIGITAMDEDEKSSDTDEQSEYSVSPYDYNADGLKIWETVKPKPSDAALMHLVYQNKADGIKELVAQGASLSRSVHSEASPLHQAAMLNKCNSLKALLETGANQNLQTTEGDTPLHLCTNAHCIQLLLDFNASVVIKNNLGQTPLHGICGKEEENLPAIQLLLDAGAPLEVCNHEQQTPLHMLCKKRQISGIQTILAHVLFKKSPRESKEALILFLTFNRLNILPRNLVIKNILPYVLPDYIPIKLLLRHLCYDPPSPGHAIWIQRIDRLRALLSQTDSNDKTCFMIAQDIIPDDAALFNPDELLPASNAFLCALQTKKLEELPATNVVYHAYLTRIGDPVTTTLTS